MNFGELQRKKHLESAAEEMFEALELILWFEKRERRLSVMSDSRHRLAQYAVSKAKGEVKTFDEWLENQP